MYQSEQILTRLRLPFTHQKSTYYHKSDKFISSLVDIITEMPESDHNIDHSVPLISTYQCDSIKDEIRRLLHNNPVSSQQLNLNWYLIM